MTNTPTPAQRAMACLHQTPNGGWQVIRECGDEFAAIPCVHKCHDVHLVDIYTYEGDGGVDLVLSITWEGEEFFIG